MKLISMNYTMTRRGDRQLGFIAQEVQQIIEKMIFISIQCTINLKVDYAK